MKNIVIAALLMSAAAAATATAISVDVPTDPKASYRIVVNRSNGYLGVVSERVGPSGTTYSVRQIDCGNQTFRYLGEGSSVGQAIERAAKNTNPEPMSALVKGSISYYIVQKSCSLI